MRKMVIALIALGLVAASTTFASNAVRISQVYGGGGNSGAYYKYDYVELFNSSGSPVNIGGWTLMYASSLSASFGGATNTYVQLPAGTSIAACGYYLIQLAAGGGGVALPVTADATGTINANATAGKFGLATSGTSGTCTTTWVDLVAYDGATQCWEGSAPAPTPGSTNTKADVRGGAGMTDTDQNQSDFTAVVCNASLTIHNSASATNPLCTVTPPTGACCLVYSMGGCILTTAANCAAQRIPGIFLGLGTTCPGNCSVPATKSTWGQVKTIYR